MTPYCRLRLVRTVCGQPIRIKVCLAAESADRTVQYFNHISRYRLVVWLYEICRLAKNIFPLPKQQFLPKFAKDSVGLIVFFIVVPYGHAHYKIRELFPNVKSVKIR